MATATEFRWTSTLDILPTPPRDREELGAWLEDATTLAGVLSHWAEGAARRSGISNGEGLDPEVRAWIALDVWKALEVAGAFLRKEKMVFQVLGADTHAPSAHKLALEAARLATYGDETERDAADVLLRAAHRLGHSDE